MSFRNYYDSSSYGRNRDTSRITSTSTERPTTVTAKYTTTPSYKSSSIPVLNDRSTREETPISTIANRYASYSKTSTDKSTSKYEKKDFSKLSVPTVNTTRSRDVSPVSTASKYSLSRTSRHSSPDRRPAKSFKEKSHDSPVERDKDIPNKTDKTTNYSSLSNYKLYPRTSTYTRPTPRVEIKPEITVNRYAIANRLSTSSYLRSPTPVKRPSLSPVNLSEANKMENDKAAIPSIIIEDNINNKYMVNKECNINGIDEVEQNEDIETITVVTRHTSPTPPGSSTYVRMRRADMAKTVEKVITRSRRRPDMEDKEIQSDRLDEPTRSSRFSNTSRTSMTNWTYYSPNVNSYTGYAGRYSTQYSSLRENNANSYNDRSSRSRSKEPVDNNVLKTQIDNEKDKEGLSTSLQNSTIRYEEINENKNDERSEIVINVNLKLKQARSPSTTSTSELVSPEITITNNHQLPPQPPKSENVSKVKKNKVRKSSTDSSSDTSSKKIVKKKSKSISSTDSEQTSEKSKMCKEIKTVSKSPTKSGSSSTQKGPLKLKYSKCRESNSPESSITLSTQSSISEDETISKSNIKETFKSSTCDLPPGTDQMLKQMPQNKNEGAEDAKSFLIRALAPVTNLFKLRNQESNDYIRPENLEIVSKDSTNFKIENGCSKNKINTNNIVASNEDTLVRLKGIRHIESGERAWWLESDTESKKSNSEKEQRYENMNESNGSDTNNCIRSLKPNSYPDDEKPWWLDSNANIPEGIERLTPPRKSSSDSDKSEKLNIFKMRRIDSGDRKDWWLSTNDTSYNSNKQELSNGLKLSKSSSDQKNFPTRLIRHIESGERPWWLSSDKNIPEGIEKLPTPPPQRESDSSDSEEVQVYIPPSQMPPFPLHFPDDEPLGTRRSPEGLETPRVNEDYRIGRSSPYENNRLFGRGSSNLPYQKGAEKYISRYTDIDDILGTSGQIYSPFMDSILARRTGQIPFDDDECQEIDPTQVRIHDSTAQMPVIKKLRCRSEIIDCRNEDQVVASVPNILTRRAP